MKPDNNKAAPLVVVFISKGWLQNAEKHFCIPFNPRKQITNINNNNFVVFDMF